MTTVGFLYPGHAAEDDYPRMQRILRPALADLELAVEHTYGEDRHAVDELLDLGSDRRLAEGAARLHAKRPTAVIWACTSGSFVYGWAGAREQADKLAAVAGVPASSTSFAFIDAARALDVHRVAIAASYPDEIVDKFVEFLAAAEIDAIAVSSQGIDTAAEVGRLTDDAVLALAKANDNAAADALLIPDTAMHTIATIDAIESAIGKPVLTANQVTVWHGLRLAGLNATTTEAGALFRSAHN